MVYETAGLFNFSIDFKHIPSSSVDVPFACATTASPSVASCTTSSRGNMEPLSLLYLSREMLAAWSSNSVDLLEKGGILALGGFESQDVLWQ